VYDVIIVGARVAGSATALLAARAGLRVLVVERKTFPADTLSTNYIHQPGCARLARWGVLDRVIASGCPPIPTTRFQVQDIVIEGGVTGYHGQIDSYAPRRHVLDSILVTMAAEAGAEVRERHAAIGLIRQHGRVSGIEIQGPDGSIKQERARLVVGADGMRSSIARLVGADTIIEEPRLTCVYYTFWAGLDCGYELYEGAAAWVGAIPTHDAILVATYFPQERFNRIRSNAMQAHLDAVRTTAPALFGRMSAARQTDRLWGTGDQQNFFRAACGPGWALVGDAGHHKDSITARGITDAIVQAELLVARIVGNVADPERLDAALGFFAADRDDLMMPGYRATVASAKLEHHEQRLPILRAVAANRRWTHLYFDVVAGIRPFAELEAAVAPRGAGSPWAAASAAGEISTPPRSFGAQAISATTQ
jgi:flavin-dependent dehydrogenase